MAGSKDNGNGPKDGPDAFWVKDYPDLKIERTDKAFEKLRAKAKTLRNTLQNLWAFKPRTAHYASEAFSCPRKVILRRRGAFPIDESGFEAMDTGSLLEDLVAEMYVTTATIVPYSKQTYVNITHPDLKYEIHGRIDLMVYEGSTLVPVEIKTTKGYGFGPDDWLAYKPRRDHAAQLMSYLYWLRNFYPPYTGEAVQPPTYGYIHYWNKNTGLQARYKIHYSNDLFSAVVSYFKAIELFEEQEGIPSLAQASDLLMAMKDRSEPLDTKKFPCRWFHKTRKSEEPRESGRCDYFGGCWEGKKFLYPEDIETDFSGVLKILAERVRK